MWSATCESKILKWVNSPNHNNDNNKQNNSEPTSAAMYFRYNTQLGPPYQILIGIS